MYTRVFNASTSVRAYRGYAWEEETGTANRIGCWVFMSPESTFVCKAIAGACQLETYAKKFEECVRGFVVFNKFHEFESTTANRRTVTFHPWVI